VGVPVLRVDPRNRSAQQLRKSLAQHVDLDALPDDLCLVIGGDGWMLRCIHELGDAEEGPAFLGLNRGHLGFLLNDVDDIADVARDLAESRWTIHRFPRLRMTASGPDDAPFSATAINDLYVERQTGQAAHLRICIQGISVVERLVCDGVLVATALGSTAYSFSAGGVPCHPLAQVVQLTPICPHLPRLSPIVLPIDAEITVEVLAQERRPVRAVADGVEQGTVRRVEVGPARSDVRLVFLEGHNFTRTMVRKVVRQS